MRACKRTVIRDASYDFIACERMCLVLSSDALTRQVDRGLTYMNDCQGRSRGCVLVETLMRLAGQTSEVVLVLLSLLLERKSPHLPTEAHLYTRHLRSHPKRTRTLNRGMFAEKVEHPR
jgi:hypothetical protein